MSPGFQTFNSNCHLAKNWLEIMVEKGESKPNAPAMEKHGNLGLVEDFAE